MHTVHYVVSGTISEMSAILSIRSRRVAISLSRAVQPRILGHDEHFRKKRSTNGRSAAISVSAGR